MTEPHPFQSELRSPVTPKPYCSVGAGQLTSFIWKSGDEQAGWRYQFNIFRLRSKGSRVTQLFAPRDLFHFVKLVQVLAAVLADDGCLSAVDRGVLQRLSRNLDALLSSTSQSAQPEPGARNGQSSNS